MAKTATSKNNKQNNFYI